MYEFNGFGKRIEALRKAKGLTQEELATRLGITSQAVSKWENDASYPDITLLPTICTILGTSLDELFGKVKDNEDDSSNAARFPQTYKDLRLVLSFKDIACYSDKEIQLIDETNVTFTDGSMAELANKRIINKGTGEIKLLTFKKKNSPYNSDSSDDYENTDDLPDDKDIGYVFGKVVDLDIGMRSCVCSIEYSGTDKTTVSIEGYPKFIESMKVDYSGNKLSLKYKDSLFGDLKYKDYHENKVIVKLAEGEVKNLNAAIHAQGELKIDAKFALANMSIHGSGIINADKFDIANMSIHGSGILNIDEANIANMSIHGSGNINIAKAGTANLAIHGSGRTSFKQVSEAVNVNIYGSGNVDVAQGEIKSLTVGIHGGGNVNAENITTDKAEIKLHGGGRVKVGRVKHQSIEQCHGGGVINILSRGE